MSRSFEKRSERVGPRTGGPYYPERPELVIAFAAAVGTPLDVIIECFERHLQDRNYKVEILRLSTYLNALRLPSVQELPSNPKPYDRISILMTRGDELRKVTKSNEVLALMTAADINARRPKPGRAMTGRAFLLRQLKHPDEVLWLRYIYGSSFLLVGVHWPEEARFLNLQEQGIGEQQARELIERDRGEDISHGQQLQKTFHMADVFLAYPPRELAADGYKKHLDQQVQRIVHLLFGEQIITPLRDEYGMYLAWAASLRSADLSRQVGACILSREGDVLGVGCNEVPAPGGGQYWQGDEGDQRDFRRQGDANQQEVSRVLDELVDACRRKAASVDPDDLRDILAATGISSLTEFGRAVHAEMAAILAAGRLGLPVVGGTLYTTTFPCHNCAKHIICSGIRRVVYIEPYPKSRAAQLHDDALDLVDLPGDHGDSRRVRVEPFIGVAPRLYPVVFAMTTPEGKRIARKDNSTGSVLSSLHGLRIGATPLSYADREHIAAKRVRDLVENLRKGK